MGKSELVDPRVERVLLDAIDGMLARCRAESTSAGEARDMLLDLRLIVREVSAFDWSVREPEQTARFVARIKSGRHPVSHVG